VSDGHRKVQPHTEQAEPGADLDPGQLPHGWRHAGDGRKDLPSVPQEPALFRLHLLKSFQIFRRVFLGADDGPQDSAEEGYGTDVEGEFYRERNRMIAAARAFHTKQISHQPRQC